MYTWAGIPELLEDPEAKQECTLLLIKPHLDDSHFEFKIHSSHLSLQRKSVDFKKAGFRGNLLPDTETKPDTGFLTYKAVQMNTAAARIIIQVGVAAASWVDLHKA